MTRLSPGDPAPPFSLPDDRGGTVSLTDYRGRRLVLFAYPAALTKGCTLEAGDFQGASEALQRAGYDIAGISPDGVERLAAFRDRDGLEYPLLSDPDHAVLEAYGAYGEKSLYGKTVRGVIRSTFVIGTEGRVENAWYGIKATGHVGRLLRDLGIDASR